MYPSPPVEYEYKDFVWKIRGGGYSMSRNGGYTMYGARMETWSHFQNQILIDLQEDYDLGWRPMGEVGPACFNFHTELRLNWLAYILATIFTMGVGLLFFFFFFDTWAIPDEFRLKLRRPKIK